MHYYEFNIGDYAKHTQHLTNEEDLAYRRALDLYYDTEKPLDTQNIPLLARRLRVGEQALQNVIEEFFPGGKNKRADENIAQYLAFIERQRINGSKGGRGNKADAKPKKPTANPTPSQPITTNHKPITNIEATEASSNHVKTRGTRFPADSGLTPEWGNVALEIRADWGNDDVIAEFASFRDYWISAPGQKGVKLDWLATWRNWCRNSRRMGVMA